jgi:hypothetical protein
VPVKEMAPNFMLKLVSEGDVTQVTVEGPVLFLALFISFSMCLDQRADHTDEVAKAHAANDPEDRNQ